MEPRTSDILSLAGDVLFGVTPDGRAVAPAGRMSQMTYPANYVDQVSMFDFNMRAWGGLGCTLYSFAALMVPMRALLQARVPPFGPLAPTPAAHTGKRV